MPPGPTILDQVRHAAVLALQEFIPPLENREVLTWRRLPHAFAYVVPFLFMAYLVRRRDTHLMRVLLLPTVITITLWCTFRFKSNDPRMAWYEWGRGLIALVVIAKSIDYSCSPDGRLKVGEKELPAIYEPEPELSHTGNADHHSSHRDGPPAERRRPGTKKTVTHPLVDALDVSFAMRGVGWDFGRHVYTPQGPSALPAERNMFVRQTVRRIVRNQLYVDAFDTIEKLLVPGVTATGGSIFLPHLPPLERYAVSTALHLGHGLLIIAGVALVYDYLSLMGVLVFGQSPSAWPPVCGDLRQARSLHDFWAKGWHQALRYTFLTFGGFPGWWMAGNVGMVLGTFLASGLFHEIGLTVAGRSIDYRVIFFFLLQAIGITLEKGFRAATARRVGGILGTLWTAVFILVFGQMCTDAWFARGIGGAWSIPPFMSVVRPLLLPFIEQRTQ